jgi:hypothetical protein
MSLVNALTGMVGGLNESFNSRETFHGDIDGEKKKSISQQFVSVFVFIIVLMVIAFFGQTLWNQFLAGSGNGKGFFTIVKPLPSLWHAMAVYLTLGLFFGI